MWIVLIFFIMIKRWIVNYIYHQLWIVRLIFFMVRSWENKKTVMTFFIYFGKPHIICKLQILYVNCNIFLNIFLIMIFFTVLNSKKGKRALQIMTNNGGCSKLEGPTTCWVICTQSDYFFSIWKRSDIS